ncbi:MAG TPA: hypothetical protein VFR23_11550 [Jiangellaceae bacterium]|nr:hypothetical protein [Jiangellaceae bacterium]
MTAFDAGNWARFLADVAQWIQDDAADADEPVRERAASVAQRLRENAATYADPHDEQCESEFVTGPMAYTPCGCDERRGVT